MADIVIPIAAPGASLISGTVTTNAGGAAVALGPARSLEGGLFVSNHDAANPIYIGGAGLAAATDGIKLAAGACSERLPIGDPSKVYVWSAAACVVGWAGI